MSWCKADWDKSSYEAASLLHSVTFQTHSGQRLHDGCFASFTATAAPSRCLQRCPWWTITSRIQCTVPGMYMNMNPWFKYEQIMPSEQRQTASTHCSLICFPSPTDLFSRVVGQCRMKLNGCSLAVFLSHYLVLKSRIVVTWLQSACKMTKRAIEFCSFCFNSSYCMHNIILIMGKVKMGHFLLLTFQLLFYTNITLIWASFYCLRNLQFRKKIHAVWPNNMNITYRVFWNPI